MRRGMREKLVVVPPLLRVVDTGQNATTQAAQTKTRKSVFQEKKSATPQQTNNRTQQEWESGAEGRTSERVDYTTPGKQREGEECMKVDQPVGNSPLTRWA